MNKILHFLDYAHTQRQAGPYIQQLFFLEHNNNNTTFPEEEIK